MIGRPYLRPVASIARPRSGDTPPMVSGAASSFVPWRLIRLMAAAARGEAGFP